MIDEEALFASAATGDADAFFGLASIALSYSQDVIPEAIGGAEVLLRLAAARSSVYKLGLASFLLSRGANLRSSGEIVRGDLLRWEAIGILRGIVAEGDDEAVSLLALAMQDLADTGDEHAAIELNTLMSAMPANQAAIITSKVADALREIDPQRPASAGKEQG